MKINTQATITSSNLLEKARLWKKPTKSKKGRKSILENYKDIIHYLRCYRHLSYKDISIFLNEEGIKTSYCNLIRFVKNNKMRKQSNNTKKPYMKS